MIDYNLESAPCFYFSCKDNGTLLNANNTLCERLGYVKEELADNKVDMLLTVATRIFYQTHLFPLLRMQGYASEIFITLQSKSREQIPMLLNATYKHEDDGAVVTIVGIEVQNRKRYEDDLIAAKNAAQKALADNTALIAARQELQHRTEDLDRQIARVAKQNKELVQFNKVITHDLQEPLRKLALFLNMLQDQDNRLGQEDIVKRLMGVSARMASVVSGLQQYVWLSEAGMAPAHINLNDLLMQAVERIRNENPDIKIELQFNEFPTVLADEAQMSALLYQLLSNAVRFRKAKNSATAYLTGHNLIINKFRNIEGQYKYTSFVKLTIRDEGIGFNPEYREQVFGLFKRLHPESGSGIGLALCHKIVNNHHGEIFIDSKEGEGATVSILIPNSFDNVPAAETQKQESMIET